MPRLPKLEDLLTPAELAAWRVLHADPLLHRLPYWDLVREVDTWDLAAMADEPSAFVTDEVAISPHFWAVLRAAATLQHRSEQARELGRR